jgi:hypothetical protein
MLKLGTDFIQSLFSEHWLFDLVLFAYNDNPVSLHSFMIVLWHIHSKQELWSQTAGRY